MKKRIPYLLVALLMAAFLTLGAAAPIRNVQIKIGGGFPKNSRVTIDKTYPVSIPVTLTYDKLIGGCGGSQKHVFGFMVEGNIHGYYNSDTGESFFRLEEVTYNVILRSEGKPEIQEIRENGQAAGPAEIPAKE